MSEPETVYPVTYESDHACLYCDTCDEFVDDDPCPACGSAADVITDCTCMDDVRDDLRDLARQWLEAIGADESATLRIEGANMGWRHLSGFRVITAADVLADPVAAIAPDTSSLNQVWKLEGDKLTAVQYHHDAPTGERYTFGLASDEDED